MDVRAENEDACADLYMMLFSLSRTTRHCSVDLPNIVQETYQLRVETARADCSQLRAALVMWTCDQVPGTIVASILKVKSFCTWGNNIFGTDQPLSFIVYRAERRQKLLHSAVVIDDVQKANG